MRGEPQHDSPAPPTEPTEPTEPSRPPIWEEQRGWIFRYFRRRLNSAEDAEDLTQQTLLTALVSQEQFRGEGSWSSWVLGIANHYLLRFLQRGPQGSRRLISAEDLSLELQHDGALGELLHTMDTAWLAERLLEHVQVCCSAEEQHILMLFYQGRTPKQIAAFYQMQDATVRSHLRRARGKILAHLVENEPETLGGQAAIDAAWQRALADSDPPPPDEQEAWKNRQKKKEKFRLACLRMARYLVVPAFLIAVMPAATSGLRDSAVPLVLRLVWRMTGQHPGL